MMIPQQDLYMGLPLRWDYHKFRSSPEDRWKFKEWREYMLTFEPWWETWEAWQNEAPEMMEVQIYLKWHDIETATDFIEHYDKLLTRYERLLS